MDTLPAPTPRHQLTRFTSAETRFFARVNKTETCWLWIGPLRGHRYAAFMVGGKTVMAHRWSYETFVGPIAEGLQIDHSCGVTKCVNPAHLRPMTAGENVLAYHREQRGTCRNGHAMTPDNVVFRLKGKVRCCRTCERARQRRYHGRE